MFWITAEKITTENDDKITDRFTAKQLTVWLRENSIIYSTEYSHILNTVIHFSLVIIHYWLSDFLSCTYSKCCLLVLSFHFITDGDWWYMMQLFIKHLTMLRSSTSTASRVTRAGSQVHGGGAHSVVVQLVPFHRIAFAGINILLGYRRLEERQHNMVWDTCHQRRSTIYQSTNQ